VVHRPLNVPPVITSGMVDMTTTKKLIQGMSAATNINLELDLNLADIKETVTYN
jgi:hypothetical protein